jgi:hypothetical protein
MSQRAGVGQVEGGFLVGGGCSGVDSQLFPASEPTLACRIVGGRRVALHEREPRSHN